MDVLIGICVFGLRLFRQFLDILSEFVYSWFYQGKHEKLPPIKSVYLLEPAHLLAKKIRLREVKIYICLLPHSLSFFLSFFSFKFKI